MKHLKTYNESDTFGSENMKKAFNIRFDKEVINDLKDICLELKDEGYNIKYTLTSSEKNHNMRKDPDYVDILQKNILQISKPRKIRNSTSTTSIIFFDEISEVIERIKEYMLSCGYKTTVNKLKTLNTEDVKFPPQITPEKKESMCQFVKLEFTEI